MVVFKTNGRPDGGLHSNSFCWEALVSCGPRACGVEVWGDTAAHVQQTVLMANPGQAISLQGSCGVNQGAPAASELGTGPGWQQSRQNRALRAVVGKWARMLCRTYVAPPVASPAPCGA